MANISNQDRKKARVTFYVFAVIFAVFTLLTVLFGILTPRAIEVKALGEGERIRSQVETKDGTEYFLTSEQGLYRYDAFTNELISTFRVDEIEKMLTLKNATPNIAGSLTQWSFRDVSNAAGDNFYFVYDGNGNLFKLADDGVNLTVTDDYYLVSQKTIIKGCDYLGDSLYLLTQESDNGYRVREYDVNNLAAGSKNAKILWDLNVSDVAAGTKKVSWMPATMGILSFEVTDEAIYVMRDGGSIIKLSLQLADCVVDGTAINYYSLADDYYANHYDEVYEQAYAQYFRTLLLADTLKNEKTEDELNAMDSTALVEYYGTLYSTTTVNAEKRSAKKAAESEAANGFASSNPWCIAYDKDTRTITIDEDYFDADYYSVLYSGESAIYGVVYSEKNDAIYYTNASDGYLYYVKQSAINAADVGAFMSDLAVRVDAVNCGGKHKFSSFGNGLGINRYANTLYVKYENERTISIVDINDMDNVQTLYTFEGDFDVYSMTGDANNKTMHVLRQTSKVALNGTSETYLYACTYNPQTFESKAGIQFIFVVCLVLTVLSLIFGLWFLRATKSDQTLNNVKTIGADLKKNRTIYFVLSFFVVLLVLFCYYEAIGAISMSFFDYTRDKPAWIWNNFANYLRIFNQHDFWLSIGNMLFFLVFDLFLCIVPPLLFAFLLVLIRNKTVSGLIRGLMFIPGIVPGMATMLIWREGIYGSDGVLNQVIAAFGGNPIAFLSNIDFSRWSLIFMGFPFIGGYLIFYGGMMNIPAEYHEAARLEGISLTRRLLQIDIPLIAPQIKYVFIMTFIDSVQNYARTYILGSAGTTTVVENMYRIMTGTQADYGMAAAYATLIFIFLFAAVATNFKMQTKETMGEDL